MAKKQKIFKPKPRRPRGLRDINQNILTLEKYITDTISKVYALYGFGALQTPSFEYAEALGKFLPDDDRPNEGVFSFEDDDQQWLSLRYDLTAPLARYVAENYDELPKPFRRFQSGLVYRNEKPEIGRFREFLQIDADTVGTSSPQSDAELCALACDCIKELRFLNESKNEANITLEDKYVLRVNHRLILEAVLEQAGLSKDTEDYEHKKLTILRAIDKLDRLGADAVRLLLGKGRKDESGDVTKGADLEEESINIIMRFLQIPIENNTRQETIEAFKKIIGDSPTGQKGIDNLKAIDKILTETGGYTKEIIFDPSIVRGLGYYTGIVFELELKDSNIKVGSIGGGGRYDDLVKRFKGVEVPAVGFSVGVSRLAVALEQAKYFPETDDLLHIMVAIMDKEQIPELAKLAQKLRHEGFKAELYMGESGLKAQLRYADKSDISLVLIEGEDERKNGDITIKSLNRGKVLSDSITDNEEWRRSEHAQKTVKKDEIVKELKALSTNPILFFNET